MSRVTIGGLADQLGLSKASVSYALNGQPGVSDDTRRRVLDLATSLGWHPSSSARALSRSRTDSIGIVLRRDPELLGSEPYYMSLLAGVESVLAQTGQSLLLRMVGVSSREELATYQQWSAERRVDGVMLFDLIVGDDRPPLLDELGMAYVVHGGSPSAAPGRVLTYDIANDVHLIVDHLAGLGHTNVLHVAGPAELAHEGNRKRLLTEFGALAGIRSASRNVEYNMEEGERVAFEALAADPGITAVVASSDLLALGVSAALRRLGRTDVAIVSWDDSLLCRIVAPAITALDRFPEEQGRRSTRMLLELLLGAEPAETEARPSELVVRATSIAAYRARPEKYKP
jgi:DNA-binding LacI/PurR family transcriptional regulator